MKAKEGSTYRNPGMWQPTRLLRCATAAAAVLIGSWACLSIAQDDASDSAASDPPATDSPASKKLSGGKKIIGATAKVLVTDANVTFRARVDTGAQSTSLHVEEIEIPDEQEDKRKNIGKKIRFLLKNHNGESAWIEGVIDRTVIVKTSEQHDRRYKVALKLRWNDLEKEVMVTLNDRSDMNYPVLLGRNFLRGDLLVDVAIDENG